MISIALANMKGGVGKSTSAMMIAEALAVYHHKRVLVVDCDPQANVSRMLLSFPGLLQARDAKQTLTSWVYTKASRNADREGMHGSPPRNFVKYGVSELTDLRRSKGQQSVATGGVSVWPSTPDLRFAELLFDAEKVSNGDIGRPVSDMTCALTAALEDAAASEDVMIFDCPPGFSTFAQSALKISDIVVSPLNVDPVSLWSLQIFWNQGLGDILQIGDRVKKLALLTLVRNSGGSKERARIRAELHEIAGNGRITTEIPFSVNAMRAVNHIAPDSRRSFREKYSSLWSDVRDLGKEINQHLDELENSQ